MIEVAKIAKKYDIPFMLDPAPSMELPDELYELVQYIVPNESEIAELTGIGVSDKRSARVASVALLNKGVHTVFSKLGAGGVGVPNKTRHFQTVFYFFPMQRHGYGCPGFGP